MVGGKVGVTVGCSVGASVGMDVGLCSTDGDGITLEEEERDGSADGIPLLDG